MILLGFPALLSKPASGSIVFPAVTVGRADIGGAGGIYGYLRPGGIVAGRFGGISGGTLSATLVPGFVTDAVYSLSEGISVVLVGDCRGLVSDVTALMDNGTPLLIADPFEYDSDNNATYGTFDGIWTATGNRTVQLV